MLTLVIILLIIGVITRIVILLLSKKRHKKTLLPIYHRSERLISVEEKQACKRYLDSLYPVRASRFSWFYAVFCRKKNSPPLLTRKVYRLTHSITRYGLSVESPQQWRYYLDVMEILIPPHWESFITTENDIELVYTQDLPLVIALNGHSLLHEELNQQNTDIPLTIADNLTATSIRKEQTNQVEMLSMRKETLAEYRLLQSGKLLDAILLCVSMLILFISLIVPPKLMLWLAIPALFLAIACGCYRYLLPSAHRLRDIKCMRGIPRCWELYSESTDEQNNISLGVIDLKYPTHWHPYLYQDLGQLTELDIDKECNVIRQGRFLSLHHEETTFPVQNWRRNAILAGGSLLVMLMMVSFVAMDMPFKISYSWLRGSQNIAVNAVDQLAKYPLKVGDILKVDGIGMCSVPGSYPGFRANSYLPFNCASIYWNTAEPLPLPRSNIITQTQQLVNNITSQLQSDTENESEINPQLASAIQKSGMILLSHFDEIVRQTAQLCFRHNDCIRLKNALVNLQNVQDWKTLVDKANSGRLKDVNVLLRPTSAHNLLSLVNEATVTFVTQETRRALELLNSPPAGGFLLINDQDNPFVKLPPSDNSLFDFPPQQQWQELQVIAGKLLHTPFHAAGMITGLKTDTNGTLHIILHDEPQGINLCRYFATAFLFIMLIVCFTVNLTLMLRRMRQNQQRDSAIKHYYDDCFNLTQGSKHQLPRWF